MRKAARPNIAIRLFDQLFSLFGQMRAWFVAWRDIRVGCTEVRINVVVTQAIEDLGNSDSPEARRQAAILKQVIKAAATQKGVEPRLNRLIEKRVKKRVK